MTRQELRDLFDLAKERDQKLYAGEKEEEMKRFGLFLLIALILAARAIAAEPDPSIQSEATRGLDAARKISSDAVTPSQVSDAVEQIKHANEHDGTLTEAFRLGLYGGAVWRLSIFFTFDADADLAHSFARPYSRLVRISQESLQLNEEQMNTILGDYIMEKVRNVERQ